MAAVGSATVDSLFRIASLSKPLAAVTAAFGTHSAAVGIDAAVLHVLPQLCVDWTADHSLTIAEVLSHTSGPASTVTTDDYGVASVGGPGCRRAPGRLVRGIRGEQAVDHDVGPFLFAPVVLT